MKDYGTGGCEGGFLQFTAGQDSDTPGFLFFDIVNPFKKFRLFFFSAYEKAALSEKKVKL
jgi:hypothetical protein